MRPGTTAWTCPECGHEHGAARMVDLAPELDREPVVPPTVVARHAAPPRRPAVKRPPTRGRLAVLAAVGIAAVLIAAFALSSLGAETQAATSSPPPTSPPTSASVTGTEALCLHLRDLQTPREESLARLATTLEDDASGFEAAGKQKLAEAVRRMEAAVLTYHDALAAQGDTSAALAQVAAAYGDLPCGAAG